MNWGDFLFGAWMGALGTCVAIALAIFIIVTVSEAWDRLKARIKKLEDAAHDEEGQ